MTAKSVVKAPLAAILAVLSAPAIAEDADTSGQFRYDDLAAYGEAESAIAEGVDPETALASYLEAGTPALRGYAERYEVTASSLAAERASRPHYYAALPGLEGHLRTIEPDIAAALDRLSGIAPQPMTVPIHYMVGDQSAGGTPLMMQTDNGPRVGIAIAIDMMAVSGETDMSEFPDGIGGRAHVSDIGQVAVHETSHVMQLRAQGGLQNYLSIYAPETGSMAAIALREGCAEYFTLIASGWRLGDRHIYGAEHEAELWAAFAPVMDAPPFSVPGWFGGTNPDHPDWPPQIGYWLGSRMCEIYHVTSDEPSGALAELFGLFSPEDARRVAAVYAEFLAQQ